MPSIKCARVRRLYHNPAASADRSIPNADTSCPSSELLPKVSDAVNCEHVPTRFFGSANRLVSDDPGGGGPGPGVVTGGLGQFRGSSLLRSA